MRGSVGCCVSDITQDIRPGLGSEISFQVGIKIDSVQKKMFQIIETP